MAGETYGPQIAAVTWTFLVLSSVATLLRIYCRAWVIKAFGVDDWLAVLAQALFIIFCAYEITGVHYGTGQHSVNLDPEAVPKAMQMWWTCEPLYVLCNMLIKASIALFLLRICITNLHRAIIWVVVGITELYSFFFFLLFVLQCRPTSLFWLRYTADPPEGHCMDASVVAKSFYAYSAISCLTDWTFSILPIFLVWNLQMNTRMKISVVGILAAGAIASSATIVRFPYLYSLTDIDDFLYSTSNVAIWSTIETGLGIAAAAAATLRPLLRKFFGGGSSAPDYQGATSGNNGGGRSRQWGMRTGGGGGHSIPGAAGPEDGFAMHDRDSKGMGVTTVIDFDQESDHQRKGVRGDGESDENPFASSKDPAEWTDNSSQSGLAPGLESSGWNITVKKSVVQTSSNV